MTVSRFSLPSNCAMRPAQRTDCWALQRLVFTLIQSEAMGFDARLLIYRLTKIFLLIGLLKLQVWGMKALPLPVLQSLLVGGIVVTAACAIATFIILILYMLLIPTEPLFNWAMYWVIECNNCPVACAALASSGDFCILYHVVVAKPWRRRSIASHLVDQLVQKSPLPVYLVCKPQRASFYTQLGFVPVSWQQLSTPLKSHFKDFETDRTISRVQWKIMCSSQGDPVVPSATVK